MNILFFLTPKSEVEFVYDDYTLRQTIEKMEYHRYSEVPVINRGGKYVGTITEGDLLWYVKEDWDLNIREAENVRIMNIKRKRKTAAVSVNANMEDLIEKAMNQNFVPVVDDKEIFIGIVKRKDIIHYCYEHMERKDDR
ncbi:MAG TPA: CBS domain-containing protein [Firmicutes bacterium]|nr:CBS domain-containing protein [Bacillota bacterium]